MSRKLSIMLLVIAATIVGTVSALRLPRSIAAGPKDFRALLDDLHFKVELLERDMSKLETQTKTLEETASKHAKDLTTVSDFLRKVEGSLSQKLSRLEWSCSKPQKVGRDRTLRGLSCSENELMYGLKFDIDYKPIKVGGLPPTTIWPDKKLVPLHEVSELTCCKLVGRR